ncbi:MAG: SDR family oxidoreductase [Prochlorococcus marinus CUG1437]|nr:SDR family oxidoreductase [Prochlorococcus marinus CUG1437]
MNKKITISGTSGYLGGMLADELSRENDVYKLRRDQIKNITKIKFSELNNLKIDLSLVKILKKTDIFIHSAGLPSSKCFDNPEEALNVNCSNTLKIFKVCQSLSVKLFIYFSSIHVYGVGYEGEILENFPHNNNHPYPASKSLTEKLLNHYHQCKSTKLLILRLSNVYGSPSNKNPQCWDLFANNICLQAAVQEKITLRSNPSIERDFISRSFFINSIKNLINILLLQKDNSALTLNLVSGNSISLAEMAIEIQKIFKNIFNKNIIIESKPRDSINKYNFSNKALQDVLNYKLSIDCKKDLENLITYCLKNIELIKPYLKS